MGDNDKHRLHTCYIVINFVLAIPTCSFKRLLLSQLNGSTVNDGTYTYIQLSHMRAGREHSKTGLISFSLNNRISEETIQG